MKRLISIILLSSILISNTEIHEIISLPSLHSHYTEHNNDAESMGFLAFFYSHYINDQDHEDDDKETNMPFKGHFCAIFVAIYHQVADYNIVVNSAGSVQLYGTHKFFINSLFQNNIWQPPKSC